MSAVLINFGIRESRNDILTMSVIVGTNSAMHSFRSQVGNGSIFLLQVCNGRIVSPLLPIIFIVNRNKAFGLSLLSSNFLVKYEVLASTGLFIYNMIIFY